MCKFTIFLQSDLYKQRLNKQQVWNSKQHNNKM